MSWFTKLQFKWLLVLYKILDWSTTTLLPSWSRLWHLAPNCDYPWSLLKSKFWFSFWSVRDWCWISVRSSEWGEDGAFLQTSFSDNALSGLGGFCWYDIKTNSHKVEGTEGFMIAKKSNCCSSFNTWIRLYLENWFSGRH